MEIKFNKVSLGNNLKNLSFTIDGNKVSAFVGSGEKKDILKLISLFEIPNKGSICFNNTEITKKEDITFDLSSSIGVVCFNAEKQFSFSRVRDEIEFVLKNYNYKLYDIDKRVNDSLKIVGLEDYIDFNPFNLSFSQQKKLSLAIALAYNPKILVLEDISIGLDSKNKMDLVRLIKMMKYKYHKTIILVSNDTNFVHMVADNVYIVDKGKIVTSGDKYKVFNDYDNLLKYGIKMPQILYFTYLVRKKKKIKMILRDDINDLIKDVYGNVR